MKTIKTVTLLFLFLCVAQIVQAQNPEIPSGIIAALKGGDSGKLSSYFSDNVQLVVGNKNDIYSRQQSLGIMTDFF
ncbi:MAG: DUF4783 domain-containing protein [Paludibacteraceae bacterium]